jgi:hypothetical protein
MIVTLHAFDKLHELRSSHSGLPNGKRHSKLGYFHVGHFMRFTENIALHNSNISNFGECTAATVFTPFRFNVLYGQILDFEAKSGGGSDESTLRSKDIMKVFHLISRPTLMLMKVL